MKGEGDAPADAQKQQEVYVQNVVQSKAEGSQRQAVMGKATFTIEGATGEEKGGKRDLEKQTQRHPDWEGVERQGKAQCQAVQESTLDNSYVNYSGHQKKIKNIKK